MRNLQFLKPGARLGIVLPESMLGQPVLGVGSSSAPIWYRPDEFSKAEARDMAEKQINFGGSIRRFARMNRSQFEIRQ